MAENVGPACYGQSGKVPGCYHKPGGPCGCPCHIKERAA
jgi:hypothetical protein